MLSKLSSVMVATSEDSGLGKRPRLAVLTWCIVVGLIVFGLIQMPPLAGQTIQITGPLPSFEVASIKPDHSGSGTAMLGFAGHSAPKDRFIATNYTIKDLICWAFAKSSFPLRGDEVSGGPSWIKSEHYDIDAKLDDSEVAALAKLSTPDADVQVKLMAQSLLANRFGLVVKNETVMRRVYVLVIAKGGPKLQETVPWSAASKSQAFSAVHGEITAHGMPINRLVWALSRVGADRPILDQTGLMDYYTFDLTWTPDVSPTGAMAGPSPSGEPAQADTSGPSLFTAIKEQLGLELKAAKVPANALVIVQIEKPAEN